MEMILQWNWYRKHHQPDDWAGAGRHQGCRDDSTVAGRVVVNALGWQGAEQEHLVDRFVTEMKKNLYKYDGGLLDIGKGCSLAVVLVLKIEA